MTCGDQSHYRHFEKSVSLSSPKVNIVTENSLDTAPFGPLSNREKKPSIPAHRSTCLRYFERGKEIDSVVFRIKEWDRYIFVRASSTLTRWFVWPKWRFYYINCFHRQLFCFDVCSTCFFFKWTVCIDLLISLTASCFKITWFSFPMCR